MTKTNLANIRISLGRVGPMAAQVFASASLPENLETAARLSGEVARLSGNIEGPFSKFAATLPTTFPWRDMGAGPTVLASATIIDPVYWTMQTPALYRVRLTLHAGPQDASPPPASELCCEYGIRPLRATANSFFLDGQRWVLRGVQQNLVSANDLPSWRDACAAMLVDNPTDALCLEASREGVLIVARLSANRPDLLSRAEELAQFAAVGFVVVDRQPPDPAALRQAASGVLLGQMFAPGETVQPAQWRDAAFVQVENTAAPPESLRRAECPVVAVRTSSGYDELAPARAACDHLQASLAPSHDLAGYLIDGQ